MLRLKSRRCGDSASSKFQKRKRTLQKRKKLKKLSAFPRKNHDVYRRTARRIHLLASCGICLSFYGRIVRHCLSEGPKDTRKEFRRLIHAKYENPRMFDWRERIWRFVFCVVLSGKKLINCRPRKTGFEKYKHEIAER